MTEDQELFLKSIKFAGVRNNWDKKIHPRAAYYPYECFAPFPLSPLYFVGNRGTVYKSIPGYIIHPHSGRRGYLSVSLQDMNGEYTIEILVHRAVMITHAFREDYEIMKVNHLDKNIYNNYYNPFDPVNNNLAWCTNLENLHHSIEHAREYDRRLGFSCYSNEQVHKVCQMVIEGVDPFIIADATGIRRDKIKRLIIDLKRRNCRLDIVNQYPDLPYPKHLRRLTDEDILNVYSLLQQGVSGPNIAAIVGRSLHSIHNISKGIRQGKYDHILKR